MKMKVNIPLAKFVFETFDERQVHDRFTLATSLMGSGAIVSVAGNDREVEAAFEVVAEFLLRELADNGDLKKTEKGWYRLKGGAV